VALVSSGKGDAGNFGKGDSQENFERMTSLARGAKGETGEAGTQGERGERGLSWRVAWAIVVLFVIAFGFGAGNLYWTSREVNANAAAQQRQQVAQQQQGAILELKLCATLGKLAALKPPTGNPATNPARAFDQVLHATLAQLGPDLGCKGN
jgi:hypothetical protein